MTLFYSTARAFAVHLTETMSFVSVSIQRVDNVWVGDRNNSVGLSYLNQIPLFSASILKRETETAEETDMDGEHMVAVATQLQNEKARSFSTDLCPSLDDVLAFLVARLEVLGVSHDSCYSHALAVVSVTQLELEAIKNE